MGEPCPSKGAGKCENKCENKCGEQAELTEPELEQYMRAPCFSLVPPCPRVIKTPPPPPKPPTPDDEPEMPPIPCPPTYRAC